MDIQIDVNNQQLKIQSKKENNKLIVEGSQKFVRFKFNLDENWAGIRVLAQFSQDGKPYTDILDESNRVYLPPQIKKGSCVLLLHGENDSGIIATSNYITLIINEDRFVEDIAEIEMSKPLYYSLIDWLERDNENRLGNLIKSETERQFDVLDLKDGFSPTIKIKPEENGNRITVLDIEGEKSFFISNGESGVSGVYVGSDDMPEGYAIQIDPEGEVDMSILTEQDKQEIADIVTQKILTPIEAIIDESGVLS